MFIKIEANVINQCRDYSVINEMFYSRGKTSNIIFKQTRRIQSPRF